MMAAAQERAGSERRSYRRWLAVPIAVVIYPPIFLGLFHLAGTVAFGSGLFIATVVAVVSGAGPGLVVALCLQGLNFPMRLVVGSVAQPPVAPAVVSLVLSAVLVLAVDRFRALVRRVTHLNQQLDEEVLSRLASEATLERNLQLYESLLSTLGEGVALFDASNRFLYANAAAGRLFGVAPEHLLGRALTEFLADSGKLVLQQSRAREHSVPVGFELRLAGQTARMVLVTETRMEPSESAEAGYLRVMRDITERSELEHERRALDQYQQRTEALHRFAVLTAGVVHDFNNLLSGVIGNVDLAMIRGERSPSSARDCLQEARHFAVEAINLSRKVLATVSEHESCREPADLASEVSESLRLVEGTLLAKAIVHNEIPAGLPMILADRTGLHQVVTNLVVNAIEAMESASSARLTLAAQVVGASDDPQPPVQIIQSPPPGEYVALSISDSGLGMSEETMAHLFEPFFTTKVHGRGMGLAASLGIIKAHRGGLTVESRVGAGTTFRVFWPLAQRARVTEPAPPHSGVKQPADKRIPLVDDEATVRQASARLRGAWR